MVNTADLHISLPAELAEVLRQAVARGEYASDSEAIQAAVLEWRLRRTLGPAAEEAICRLWDEGIASGPGRFRDMTEIKAEARRRLGELN
jgi:antitoxin ParD1/3/4